MVLTCRRKKINWILNNWYKAKIWLRRCYMWCEEIISHSFRKYCGVYNKATNRLWAQVGWRPLFNTTLPNKPYFIECCWASPTSVASIISCWVNRTCVHFFSQRIADSFGPRHWFIGADGKGHGHTTTTHVVGNTGHEKKTLPETYCPSQKKLVSLHPIWIWLAFTRPMLLRFQLTYIDL